MLHNIIKVFAPFSALALGVAVASCGDNEVRIGDGPGLKLAELDLSGPPPEELVLAGPDRVVLTEGEMLSIEVEGDEADRLRFGLEDGILAIAREKASWNDAPGATVRVTMPAPRALTLAGSGRIEAPTIADRAEITIAGSGEVAVSGIKPERLEINLAGSGGLRATGAVQQLDLNILGSGRAQMEDLKVERAEVNIAGSGEGRFASDGKVEANIVGSGRVVVIGRAQCSVSALGSGKLVCEAGPSETDEKAPVEN